MIFAQIPHEEKKDIVCIYSSQEAWEFLRELEGYATPEMMHGMIKKVYNELRFVCMRVK